MLRGIFWKEAHFQTVKYLTYPPTIPCTNSELLPAARTGCSFIFHIHNTLWASLAAREYAGPPRSKQNPLLLELTEVLNGYP